MIFGYNTDVKGGDGTTYHVQTEDRGRKKAIIDSVIYVKGQIVEKRRTRYVPGEASTEQVQEMVKKQHRELVDSIKNGTFVVTAQEEGEPESGQPAEPPTVELLNPNSVEKDGRLLFSLRAPSGARVRGFLEVDGARSGEVEATAGEEGRAELAFPLPPGPRATVLFRAVVGRATQILKFVVKRQ